VHCLIALLRTGECNVAVEIEKFEFMACLQVAALLALSASVVHTFTGDCLLEVYPKTYLDGPCNIEMRRRLFW
jgi:hypothetical protein